jgi:tRNA dimethylallyltransferase
LQGRRRSDAVPPVTIPIALLPPDRARLHVSIAARFTTMIDAGLVGEVVRLRNEYALDPDMPSMRCVGYRQVWAYLEGDIDAATMRGKAIAATRQLAKRQLTWLRATEATPFDPERGGTLDAVTALLAAHGIASS